MVAEPREPRSSGRKSPWAAAASQAVASAQPAWTVIVCPTGSMSSTAAMRSSDRATAPSAAVPSTRPVRPPQGTMDPPAAATVRSTWATSGVDCLVRKASERLGDLHHVASLRRQAQGLDTGLTQSVHGRVGQMHTVGEGLYPVDRQERLAVDRAHVQSIWILLADELAGVLVPAVVAGVIATAGEGERQAAIGEELKLEGRAGC